MIMRMKECILSGYYRFLSAVLLLFLGVSQVCGQERIFFINNSEILDHRNVSRLALAVADVNGDYRDDIIHTDINDNILIDFQLNNGALFHQRTISSWDGKVTTVNVGDYNNDGINDIFLAGRYNGYRVFTFEESSFDIIHELTGEESFFAQGSALFDIDNNGFLDVLYTHDEGTNITLMNNSGAFSPEDVIDFSTDIPSDNSGNYSSVWLDANNDDKPDLYIAKCKVNVTSDRDPRRINTLYLYEDEEYIESGRSYNLDIGDQSWAVDAGDLDNDGDEDMFLVNHVAPHLILRNDDGVFSSIDSYSRLGPITTPDLQVHIADYNNDMWLDILIAGQNNYLLYNKGDMTFDVNENPFGFYRAASFACGDLNGDGNLDVYCSYNGSTLDDLFFNSGNGNNYAFFSLNGSQSNKNGIGSKLTVYSGGHKLVRWLRSGSSYGITNSLNVHFGLAKEEIIDSLICQWPSGVIDKYYDLNVNGHYVITEGECMASLVEVDSHDDFTLGCDGEAAAINADYQGDVIWSNGISGDQVSVSNRSYLMASSVEGDCPSSSAWTYIDTVSIPFKPELSITQDSLLVCPEQVVSLSSLSYQKYLWNNGTEYTEIEISEPGSYYIEQSNECGVYNSDTLHIEYITSDYIYDTLTFFGPQTEVLLSAGVNNEVNWYSDETFSNLVYEGREFTLSELSKDTVMYYEEIYNPESILIENRLLDESLFTKVDDVTKNRLQFFTVHEDLKLNSFSVTARYPGVRVFQLYDIGSVLLKEVEADLSVGRNDIIFDIELEREIYYMTTSEEVNLENFASKGPGLNISERRIENPSELGGYLSVLLSDYTLFYFYNWSVSPSFKECAVSRGQYNIEIQSNSVSDNQLTDVSLFPNPSEDILWIRSKQSAMVEVFDMKGVMVSKSSIMAGQNQFNIKNWESGVYVIRVSNNNGSYSQKILKL